MIRKFLDISTAHLSVETREWLSGFDWSRDGPTGGATAYGWLIHASDQRETLVGGKMEPFPNDLWHVFEYARTVECDYVNFDCDAEIIDELPTFEEAG